jgi:predicted enzyme related to lactoylglutathione lyase
MAETAIPHGKFVWNELMTHDVEKAKTFYRDVIGWNYDSMPGPEGSTYWIIKVKGAEMGAGGMFPLTKPEMKQMPEQWLSYIAVDDIDARVKKAKAAGAKVMREPFDIPDVGRIAILHEPGGAMIGWITPKPRM